MPYKSAMFQGLVDQQGWSAACSLDNILQVTGAMVKQEDSPNHSWNPSESTLGYHKAKDSLYIQHRPVAFGKTVFTYIRAWGKTGGSSSQACISTVRSGLRGYVHSERL